MSPTPVFTQNHTKIRIYFWERCPEAYREVNNSKAGEAVLNKFIENLEDIVTVEKKPKLEGRNMFTILAKKTDK